MRDGTVRRRGFDRQRLLDVEDRVRHIVVVAAEVAHRSVAEIPPAVPTRTGEVGLVERPRGAGPIHKSKFMVGGIGISSLNRSTIWMSL